MNRRDRHRPRATWRSLHALTVICYALTHAVWLPAHLAESSHAGVDDYAPHVHAGAIESVALTDHDRDHDHDHDHDHDDAGDHETAPSASPQGADPEQLHEHRHVVAPVSSRAPAPVGATGLAPVTTPAGAVRLAETATCGRTTLVSSGTDPPASPSPSPRSARGPPAVLCLSV